MTGILKFNNVEVFGSNGKVTASGMPTGSVFQQKRIIDSTYVSNNTTSWNNIYTGIQITNVERYIANYYC